jgi:ABC-2 type transport system ATP-binding protein
MVTRASSLLASTPADGHASAASAEPTVRLDGVGRRFGNVQALEDLTLAVPSGSITVLLGPNGAGKTTATRIITGALDPNSGTVRVFGLDPAADGHEVRRRCGVVSAKPALYDRLTGWDNLSYAAELYDLGRGEDARRRISASAERFGIENALDSLVGGYSTGMKTRLALARSVLHEPELLLFDEPTSGLDPESSLAVLDLIRQFAGSGTTVVMCTHLLLEAEGLAEQVVVMESGRTVAAGEPAELVRRYWPFPSVLFVATPTDVLAGLAQRPGVMGAKPAPGGLRVTVDDLNRVPDLVDDLVRAGARLSRVEPHDPTLEDLYFAVRRQQAALAEDAANADGGGSSDIADDGGRRLRPSDREAAVLAGFSGGAQ